MPGSLRSGSQDGSCSSIAAVDTGVNQGEGKQQRREVVKGRLRTALCDLAADRTFRDVTVAEITTAAGLSRSAFYFYYDDKRDLLIEAVEGISGASFALTSGHLDEDRDAAETLKHVLRANAAAWKVHAPLLRSVVEASTYDEVVGTFWSGIIVGFMETVIARLRTDQGRGLIPDEIDVTTCGEILVTATIGFFYHRIGQGEMDPEDAVAALEPIWMRTLYC